jgi:hypothetical protein
MYQAKCPECNRWQESENTKVEARDKLFHHIKETHSDPMGMALVAVLKAKIREVDKK